MGRRWEASQEPDVILQLAAGTANFQIVHKGAYIHGYKQTTCSSELVVVSDVRKSGASPKMRASQGAPKIDGGNPVHTWKIPTLPTFLHKPCAHFATTSDALLRDTSDAQE